MASEDQVIASVLAGDTSEFRKLVEQFHPPVFRFARNLIGDEHDAVVFRTSAPEPPRKWVKRVIGVAGDQLSIKGHDIEVNGQRLERERAPTDKISQQQNQVEGDVYYESHSGRRYRVIMPNHASESRLDEINITVPDNSIFVLGDNRDGSRDSRHFGSMHVDEVIGNVEYIYYPAETWSRIGWFRD